MAGWETDKGIDRYILHTLLVSSLVLLSLVILAGASSAARDLPFTEDFDDGDMDGWVPLTSGNGVVKVDKVQNKSAPYALHIKSPNAADRAAADLNITYNHSLSVLIQFDFRYTGGHHWIFVYLTWETQVVVDGGRLLARESYRNNNINIQSISANRWYHIKIFYNATTEKNTIWVDDVQRLTWNEDHFRHAVNVGELFTNANHGEAFWDNFNITYFNAPNTPDLIRPMADGSFNGTPEMEWNFTDPSPGDHQTAYRVQVDNTTAFIDPLMDTGVINGTNRTYQPDGLPFGTYFCRVRVKDNESMWSDWCNPRRFTVLNTNKPPKWGVIPTLEGTEDVPATFDFLQYISDEDDILADLSLECNSPFVEDISAFNITFLFTEGITEPRATILVHDPWRFAVIDVSFSIEPVNDPPSHNVPEEHQAVEDTPYMFNISPYVQDVDNTRDQLYIDIHDKVATSQGLEVTFTFPDGIITYDAWFNLTDGEFGVPVHMSFIIEPVNDPPVFAPMDTFRAIEDQVSILDLSAYITDVDNPAEDLTVIVRSARCTVHGLELHFHNSVGGFNETLLVQVTDGWTMVEAYLEVYVEERDDAPTVYGAEPQQFTEDEEKTIDMTAYVFDEDNAYEDLTLTCKHPSLVSTDGLTLTLNYTAWQPEHQVYFNVSDGYMRAQGQFLVQVLSVNDHPRILGIGDQEHPILFEMDEGSSSEHQVRVFDDDDTNFKYLISTQWAGATLNPLGMLFLDALHGDVGEYAATISVEDPEKARDSLMFTIVVLNVNDPPDLPLIMKPTNHTIVERGANVTFAVSVTDPDQMYGQVLTVTWTSNISGVLATMSTGEGVEFTTSNLPTGVHRITVQVSDGEHVKERWLVLEIIEPYVPPPPVEDTPFLQTTSGIGLILLVVLAVIIVALLLVMRSRKSGQEAEVKAPEEPEVTALEDEPKDLAALSVELGAMADELEAARPDEPLPMLGPELPAAAPAVLDLEDVKEPTAEEYAEREHAVEVREVMKVLTQLPRGLPTTLWGKDMSELAREIVDGPKKTEADGNEYVEVDGRWYNADHTNIGSFLSEFKKKEKKERPKPQDDVGKVSDKLDKLEERLLDGDISEETYERLRKKYEDS